MVITPSKGIVNAQTPTVTGKAAAKPPLSENISLQFFIDQGFTMTVKGVIELTNTSGKDISLTKYDMNLPYFTLKDTTIGYVYPKGFLVDMYSQNNSILFTFKSQFTKPVVIGKNAKITFTFSATVDKPYVDIGGLRTLSFPFSLESPERVVSITVNLNDKLPIVYGPNVASALKKRGIYSLSEESGKIFLFSISDKPITVSFASTTEVTLPKFLSTQECITYEPVSCSGCGDVVYHSDTQQTLAQKQSEIQKVAFVFTQNMNTLCGVAHYKTAAPIDKITSSTFTTGYVISPTTNRLIPATWKTNVSGKNTEISNVYARGVPYSFADTYGYLTIPLIRCSTESECNKESEKLQTLDTAISSVESIGQALIPATAQNITLSLHQTERQFSLRINNTSDNFLFLETVTLSSNLYFTLPTTASRIIPPKGSADIVLLPVKQFQTSNQDEQLQFQINGMTMQITFKPITITILTIIETLSYLFIVALGITAMSWIGLILYNKYYEKRVPQTK